MEMSMSRTTAHRPPWVHNREGRDQWHDHDLFGAPRTAYRTVVDERGKPVTETVSRKITLAAAIRLVSLFDDDETRVRKARIAKEARRRLNAGASRQDLIDGPEVDERVVREERVISYYADHCTIDEKVNRDGRLEGTDVYAPCHRWANAEEASRIYGRSKGEKQQLEHHRPLRERRAHAKSVTRDLTRLADTGYDLEDIDEVRL